MLLQFALLSYFGFRRRMRWAWPHRELPSKHFLSTAILAVFIVELFVLFFVCPPHRLLFYAFLVPFQAIGLGLAILAFRLPGFEDMMQWCVIMVGVATLLLVAADKSVLPLVAPAVSLMAWRFYERRKRLKGWRIPTVGRLYLMGSVASLIILGFLPGMLFFKAVYHDHLKSYVKYGQLAVAEGLHERLSDGDRGRRILPEDFERLDVTVAAAPFFSTCVRIDGQAWPPSDRQPPCDEAFLESETSKEMAPAVGVEAWFWRHLPFLSKHPVEMRRLFSSGGGDGTWSWRETRDEHSVHLKFGEVTVVEALSRIPADLLRFDKRFLACVGFLASLAVAAILILYLAWYQGHRVFLLDFEPASAVTSLPLASDQAIDRHLLIICPQQCDRTEVLRRPEVHPVDLKQFATFPEVAQLVDPRRRPVVCVDHFGLRLGEPEWNRALLEWLEQLVYVDQRILVLLSGREPGNVLAGAIAGAPDGDRQSLRGRWTRLLASFQKITIHPQSDSDEFHAEVAERFEELRGDDEARVGWRTRLLAFFYKIIGSPSSDSEELGDKIDELERLLKSECAGRAPLESAARTLLQRDDLTSFSRDALIEQIREVAEGYYRLLWANLSGDEKFMVVQIANGALVNPHWRMPLRRLMALGLVRRDSELRLFNHSFGRFVREEIRPEEITRTEQAGSRSTWDLVRQPLFIGLIVVAVFLYVTQRHVFQASLGLVSALAISVPAIFKLMGFLRQPGAGEGEG